MAAAQSPRITERFVSWQSEPTSPQLNTNTDFPRRK